VIDLSLYVFEALRNDEEFILYRGQSKDDASQVLVLSPRGAAFHTEKPKTARGHTLIAQSQVALQQPQFTPFFGRFGKITENHFDKTFDTNVRRMLFAGSLSMSEKERKNVSRW
jgi:hypothetical protein